jgi:hypothetical protein
MAQRFQATPSTANTAVLKRPSRERENPPPEGAQTPIVHPKCSGPTSEWGQNAKYSERADDFRFAPIDGHHQARTPCRNSANSGPTCSACRERYASLDIDRRKRPVLMRCSRSILTLSFVRWHVVPVAKISFIGVQ